MRTRRIDLHWTTHLSTMNTSDLTPFSVVRQSDGKLFYKAAVTKKQKEALEKALGVYVKENDAYFDIHLHDMLSVATLLYPPQETLASHIERLSLNET
jgi:hypothetical protein